MELSVIECRNDLSNFRSQAMLGRYSKATQLGKALLRKLNYILQIGLIDHTMGTEFVTVLEQQVQVCIQLRNILVHNSSSDFTPSKWNVPTKKSDNSKNLDLSKSGPLF